MAKRSKKYFHGKMLKKVCEEMVKTISSGEMLKNIFLSETVKTLFGGKMVKKKVFTAR